MRSLLGFRSPSFNGSSQVSNKGLWNPNGVSNVINTRTNILSINITIIINIKNMVRIVSSRKVTTRRGVPCDTIARSGSLICMSGLGLLDLLLVLALLWSNVAKTFFAIVWPLKNQRANNRSLS